MGFDRRKLAIAAMVSIALTGTNTMAAALDDATIFAIFDQANSTDITMGRIGAKRGASKEVRELGKMVATHHEEAQQTARELAKKLGIVPTPPDNDTSIENQAKTVALLQAKTGPEFDKAYLLHELAFHRSAIDAVKSTLLPAAKNTELQALMREMLPAFEHHLAATQAAATKLGIKTAQ